ncbi:MAG: 30S ribosomal protein S6 [Clostridia bacterium]|nr:30S ribosomal protein S6 [Clostridia bacterium]
MNKYEVVYIIDPAVEEEARKALIAKYNELITGNGGTVDKVEEWGKRRLAYAIDYKTEGYYVLVNFQAESELPKELERNLQISESVIRYQVIRIEERKSSVKPRPVRVAPAAPVAEAPVETPAAE